MRAMATGSAFTPLRNTLPPKRPSVFRKATASISVVLPARGRMRALGANGRPRECSRLAQEPTSPLPSSEATEREAPMSLRPPVSPPFPRRTGARGANECEHSPLSPLPSSDAPAPEAPMSAVSVPGRHQPEMPRRSGRTSLFLSVTVYVIFTRKGRGSAVSQAAAVQSRLPPHL